MGVCCRDGVVLAAEKLALSKMMEPGSHRRTHRVDRHAGAAVAGLAADGRAVVDRAQAEASGYKAFYGARAPGRVLAERLASYVHVFNLYWYVRPFGVVTLLATYDAEEGPALWVVEPSGAARRHRGAAVGKGRQTARNELEKLDYTALTCREAVAALARALHAAHDEEKGFELEMAWVCDESGREFGRVPAELVAAADAAARAALEADDMDD